MPGSRSGREDRTGEAAARGTRTRPEPDDYDDYEREPADGEYGGPEEYEEDRAAAGRRAPARRRSGRLTALTAGRTGLRHISELTGKDVEGVIAVKPSGEGFAVEVEVVEDHRVPSSGDTLGVYLAELDADGDLVSYHRIRSFKRAKGDTGGAG
ncbi:gas vesicle protein GvpO [Sphaerisporangium rufum]|uniref:gas vesicle protein GvpO n=1 Tax=Sphaerisporangium rufum TaxID=1381558 RepID=UPI001EF36CF9|nr:gas vesicle protein GvpO [Sphaerisporangium rufum]